MNPTWESDGIQLYQGDCLDILPTLESGSVDAVVTDPPYGVGKDYATYDDTKENLKMLIAGTFEQMSRVANRLFITCGIGNIWEYPPADWVLCWYWANCATTGGWGFNNWQPILAYGKDVYLPTGRRQDAKYLNISYKEAKGITHPCVKPVEVMRWIVERNTFPDATILDPFMGSGTTGVACVQTGRKFIGIEIDPGYFEIAKKRIVEAQAQMRLPGLEAT